MSNPLGEGQTVVSSKGKGLTCRGGIEGDVSGDDNDENHAGQSIDASGRNGSAKDIYKWIAGGIAQSIVDTIDGKEIRD